MIILLSSYHPDIVPVIFFNIVYKLYIQDQDLHSHSFIMQKGVVLY